MDLINDNIINTRNEFKYKFVTTISIFICYFGNAVNFYILPPTLVTLSEKMNTDVEVISLIYTIRSATYTFGALSGFAFKYLNRQFCLVIFSLILGITLVGLGTSTSLVLFFIIGAINGFMAGGSDTAINAWMLEMWSENSGPYMQALHFSFGGGSIIAPLIAQPFLLRDDVKSKLFIPYMIGASTSIIGGLFLLFLFMNRRYRPREPEDMHPIESSNAQSITDELAQEIVDESQRYDLTPKNGLILVVFSCILLATYLAMEMTQFSYQPTFVYFSSNMSESDASTLASATAVAFTVTRGIGIFVAMYAASHYILFTHFAIIIGANVLIIFTYKLAIVWTWIANIIIGIGCSSVYPTIYAFLQQCVEIDNKKAAIFLFVGGASSSIYPYIVGKSIENHPLVLVYLNIASIILCIIILFVIRILINRFRSTSRKYVVEQLPVVT